MSQMNAPAVAGRRSFRPRLSDLDRRGEHHGLAASEFLLDPRRLTVAMSRAKRKLILVASRSIFELFSANEETFANSQLWKNLLRRTCTELLWEGVGGGQRVAVWGAGHKELMTRLELK
jgi:hypothetical protein